VILPLLYSSTPLFPTPLLGVGGWPLGYEEQRCGLTVCAISFQDFQPMWSWSTNVTDRRTDDMRSHDRASASCGNNSGNVAHFKHDVFRHKLESTYGLWFKLYWRKWKTFQGHRQSRRPTLQNCTPCFTKTLCFLITTAANEDRFFKILSLVDSRGNSLYIHYRDFHLTYITL